MTMPTMGDAERRAIVWDTIERMAFRPANDRDQNTWLRIYEKALPTLLELEPGNVQPHQRDRQPSGFAVPFLDVSCEYFIRRHDEYSVTLSIGADRSRPVVWHLHVDPKFPSRRGYCELSAKYPQQDEAKCLDGDIEAALDGMIFHPRNHAHAKDLGVAWPDGQGTMVLSTHEMRLGGGIENAFVFLAHLRYQLCLLSEDARAEERRRLNGLFAGAIRSKTKSVPPKDVLNPRY